MHFHAVSIYLHSKSIQHDTANAKLLVAFSQPIAELKGEFMDSLISRTPDTVRKNHTLFLPALIALLLILISCSGAQTPPTSTGSATGTWSLVWSDEFDGSNGSSPDTAKWSMESGGNGWGNNELEYYTARTQNAQVNNGNLVITAQREDYTGPDGVSRQYTSARLKTSGKFSQKYGRFEARIKIPKGQGMWPAFWMLGDNFGTAGWPQCGEIDIMENVGSNPTTVLGTLHGPGYSGSSGLTSTYTLTGQQQFSDDFHVMAVEWEANVVRFYVDGNLYKTRTPADLPAGATWVFDHPFSITLNVAVGGKLPGAPDATTQFPQTMLVDYVRVFSRQ